jgi:glutaminyl-peptide cyclotransferase
MARQKAQHKKPAFRVKRRKRSPAILMWICLAAVVGGLAIWFLVSGGAGNPAADTVQEAGARRFDYEVVRSYPHDPAAFLQGLLWHEGGFYESTGLYGRSTLRRVEFPSGKILKSISLQPDLFGEGLALVGNRLIQLTWKSKRGFVYDRTTFAPIREFQYDTEGWGITYDGKSLIMSDGSSDLMYLDPNSFEPLRKLAVTMNGKPIVNLNELEFIEGEIWSNVWQTDLIVRIDPGTGKVTSFLNLGGILPAGVRSGNEDVLNGIAYDAQQKRIFVSGKLWPRIFEIRVK